MAVKTLREDQVESNREEFLREARVMMELRNPNIVRLIALCNGPPLMMVIKLFKMQKKTARHFDLTSYLGARIGCSGFFVRLFT